MSISVLPLISPAAPDLRPSLAVGGDAAKTLEELRKLLKVRTEGRPTTWTERPSEERHPTQPSNAMEAANATEAALFDSRAAAKIATASVAMHLSQEWRTRFFAQIDSLLDIEDWEAGDTPPTRGSYQTLLRSLIHLSPCRRPGLGVAPDGNMIAFWQADKDRLTIEMQENDRVRWVVSRDIDGRRETAAGSTSASRIKSVLAPYNPERWFSDGQAPVAR